MRAYCDPGPAWCRFFTSSIIAGGWVSPLFQKFLLLGLGAWPCSTCYWVPPHSTHESPEGLCVSGTVLGMRWQVIEVWYLLANFFSNFQSPCLPAGMCSGPTAMLVWLVDLGWLSGAHQAALSLFRLSKMGEKIEWESLLEIRTGNLPTSYHNGQNRLSSGKINLIYFQL